MGAEALYRFIGEQIVAAGFRVVYDERSGLPLSVWLDPIPRAIGDLIIDR